VHQVSGGDRYIHLYSGRKFWPLNPKVEDVSLDDVAHHLSQKCRYTGATIRHYSVAEHAYLLSYAVPEELAYAALHHDDNEAFLADIPSPVKPFIPGWAEIEKAHERVIAIEAFGCREEDLKAVTPFDKAVIYDEAAHLLQVSEGETPWWEGKAKGLIHPKGMLSSLASARFKERHRELRARGFGKDAPLDLPGRAVYLAEKGPTIVAA
jgi:uncharacterized protein